MRQRLAKRAQLKLTPKSIDLRRQAKVVEAMLEDGDKVLDRNTLLKHLKRFGISGNTSLWAGMDHFSDFQNKSRMGPAQIPTELVDYLLYAGRLKPDTIAEIGIFNGGMSVFSAAFFQAINKDMVYHCIDIEDHFQSRPLVKNILNLEFHIPASSDDLAGEVFDVVFIDGDHSYEWAKRDFENLGKHARKLCAFHDIHGQEYIKQGGGVFQFWRNLRSTIPLAATMLEISHAASTPSMPKALWMGIGLIHFDRE